LPISEKAIQKPLLAFFAQRLNEQPIFELIGGNLVAGDSNKLRAQNSKKNNFNPGKIERHIIYIDARLEEYNADLAKEEGNVAEKETIANKVKKHTVQK